MKHNQEKRIIIVWFSSLVSQPFFWCPLHFATSSFHFVYVAMDTQTNPPRSNGRITPPLLSSTNLPCLILHPPLMPCPPLMPRTPLMPRPCSCGEFGSTLRRRMEQDGSTRAFVMSPPSIVSFRCARHRPLYVPLRAMLLITLIHPPPPRCHLIPITIPLIATWLLSGEASNDAISRADRVNGEFDPSLGLSHQANKIKPPRMMKLLFKFHLNMNCLNCEEGQTKNKQKRPH